MIEIYEKLREKVEYIKGKSCIIDGIVLNKKDSRDIMSCDSLTTSCGIPVSIFGIPVFFGVDIPHSIILCHNGVLTYWMRIWENL